MRPKIHPKYYPEAKVICACGNTWTTGATVPEIKVDVCSACHPFFTGRAAHRRHRRAGRSLHEASRAARRHLRAGPRAARRAEEGGRGATPGHAGAAKPPDSGYSNVRRAEAILPFVFRARPVPLTSLNHPQAITPAGATLSGSQHAVYAATGRLDRVDLREHVQRQDRGTDPSCPTRRDCPPDRPGFQAGAGRSLFSVSKVWSHSGVHCEAEAIESAREILTRLRAGDDRRRDRRSPVPGSGGGRGGRRTGRPRAARDRQRARPGLSRRTIRADAGC